MRRALTYARDFDALIVHHTEDPDLIGEGVMNEGEFAARLGLLGVPKAAETIMLERDMRLVALTDGRYHAASITCAESLEVLRRAKDAGLQVTASASINHLTLNEIDVGPYRTFFKMSPPLRAEDDRKALVEAVEEGLIDVVMSDHNPQDVEAKRLPFAEAAPGAIGLETMLPAGLRLVHNGEIKLMTLLKALSTRPAELLGLPGGIAAARRAGRRGRDRSRRALGARPRRAEVEMQEHAVRRGAAAGPRGAHHRRRPHGLRIRVIISPRGTRTLYIAIGSRGICSARSRSAVDALRRRHSAVGSGNIGATNVLRTGRKGLAPRRSRRHAQGHRRGPAERLVGPTPALAGARRRARPCLPGLAQVQRRQRRRDLHRRADRGVVAGRAASA